MDKKLKELAGQIFSAWAKKYPKTKLANLKGKAIKEALDQECGWDYVYDEFYESLSGEGANMARKALKGKIPASKVEEVAELVEEYITEALEDIKALV